MNKSTAVLVIDAQKEYGPDGTLSIAGIENQLKQIAKILSVARKEGYLIIHIRHISPNPNDTDFAACSAGIEFLSETAPQDGEIVLTKHYPGSFTNPELDHTLLKKGIEQLVICGFTTFLCCDTTAREAYQKGYRVFFIEDAVASFDLPEISGKELHKVACAIQRCMFSQVVDTECIINDVLRQAKN